MRDVPDRFENAAFFPAPALPGGARAAPGASTFPDERGFFARAATSTRRFALVLSGLGWLGILAQRSFLQQVVVGAPVFEEFAKLGLALLVVAMLGARSAWARLPYAWLCGLGFGVLEHVTTYPDEPWAFFVERVLFHAGVTGLSMVVYSVLEDVEDVRARWATTAPATLLHWANNFGAVLAAILSLLLPVFGEIALGWSALVTASTFALTFSALARPHAWRLRLVSGVNRFLPRTAAIAPTPPVVTAPAAEEGPPSSAEPAERTPAAPEAPPRQEEREGP